MTGSLLVRVFVAVALLLHLDPLVALPPGFREEAVTHITGLSTVTFVPGREGGKHVIFAGIKDGLVEAIFDPDEAGQVSVTVLDISDRVCNNGERGLHQVMAHPNFLETNYIYISYTFDKNGDCLVDLENGAVNRLSRFTVSEDYTIEESSEEVFVETKPLGKAYHNSGDIVFGNDGYLYSTIGDGGMDSSARDLSSLFGTIIRLTDDGEIPPDNPFLGDDSVRCRDGSMETDKICQEIFAYGFRNPYRFAMNPNTDKSLTQLFVLDVGGSKWEEISEAGTKFPGADYGWHIREGPCERDSYDDCDPPESDMIDPIYWYPHNVNGSGCITGGAFVPNGLWSQEYDDSFLFSDYVWGKLYVIKQGAEPCPSCRPPIPAWGNQTFYDLTYTGNARPVQMLFGPYKDTLALYFTTQERHLNLRRIIFEGSDNVGPIAKIALKENSGPVGVSLEFDGSESSDPDGDEIKYLWDFGDKNTSTSATAFHAFNAPGNYVVVLTVTDPSGYSSTAEANIAIGTPPIITMNSPAENTTFAVGDVLRLVGSSVDGDGNPLPDMALTWEVRKHHSTHYHPYLDPTIGNNITLDPAPSPEEFLAATNSYLEVLLTARDSWGLEATLSRFIMPRIVMLSFDTIPSGLQILLDGYMLTTPVTVATWENHPLEVAVVDQDDLVFQDWSDGGDSMHTIIVGNKENSFYARFATTETPTPSAPMTSGPTTSSTTMMTPSPTIISTTVTTGKNESKNNNSMYALVLLILVFVPLVVVVWKRRSKRGGTPTDDSNGDISGNKTTRNDSRPRAAISPAPSSDEVASKGCSKGDSGPSKMAGQDSGPKAAINPAPSSDSFTTQGC